MLGRSDAQLVAQVVWIAPQHRGQDLLQHALRVVGVFRDPGPHRRERVGEPIGIPSLGVKLLGQRLLRGLEDVRRRVVRGREPPVAEARDPAKSGLRAPAPDPDRDSARPAWSRRQFRARQEERAKAGDGYVEALPALLEGHADRVAVALRRARTDSGDHAPVGQDIQCGERLREGHGTAQRHERDRCRELHRAGSLDHRGQRRQAVEPGRLKQEVVVGGDGGEAAVTRGVDRACETCERLPLAAEFHQRRVQGEFQTGPILSSRDPLVEKRDDLARAAGGLVVVEEVTRVLQDHHL